MMNQGYNPFSLSHKKILITGASSGIGQACAIECSRMGAQVVITGRSETKLADTYMQLSGNGHLSIIADLLSDLSIKQLVEKLPVLDGVVLCSGISKIRPIVSCSRDLFYETFNSNLFSPVELLRSIVRNKKIEHSSSIVFIGSIGGTNSWYHSFGIYNSTKAALQSIMHNFAVELALQQIRVNIINPGLVRTPMASFLSEDLVNQMMKQSLLNRIGMPIDIARSAVFLLSDASSWITGQSLVVDGGITAY